MKAPPPYRQTRSRARSTGQMDRAYELRTTPTETELPPGGGPAWQLEVKGGRVLRFPHGIVFQAAELSVQMVRSLVGHYRRRWVEHARLGPPHPARPRW